MLVKTRKVKEVLAWSKGKIDLLDAELLLAHTLHSSREKIFARPERKLSYFQVFCFKRLVNKRHTSIPIAYLTGHKEFYGLDFLVNQHTLVPRPDTELMVSEVVDRLQTSVDYRPQTTDHSQVVMIDVGTGSGCIPISVLKSTKHKPIKTFATDISRQALRVAKKNTKLHNTDITFLQGNLLDPILNKSEVCNLKSEVYITANLPYLTESEFQAELSIQHEPKSALVAEKDGLELYEKLLKQVAQYISPIFSPGLTRLACPPIGRGRANISPTSLFLEINPWQIPKLTKICKNIFPSANLEIKKDLAGRDRLVVINIPAN